MLALLSVAIFCASEKFFRNLATCRPSLDFMVTADPGELKSSASNSSLFLIPSLRSSSRLRPRRNLLSPSESSPHSGEVRSVIARLASML